MVLAINVSFSNHDNIKTFQFFLIAAETFANSPLYPVPATGQTDIFSGDCKTKPGPVETIRPEQNNKIPVFKPSGGFKYFRKI